MLLSIVVVLGLWANHFPLPVAYALEGGGSHYFGEGEDFYSGSWPQPGLAFNGSVLYLPMESPRGTEATRLAYRGDADSPIPGLEVSAKFMYYSHTINTATRYASGQEFSLDYLIGKHFGQMGKLGAGMAGHFQYQVMDDDYRNAPSASDGYKARQFTVGPALQYWVSQGFSH